MSSPASSFMSERVGLLAADSTVAFDCCGAFEVQSVDQQRGSRFTMRVQRSLPDVLATNARSCACLVIRTNGAPGSNRSPLENRRGSCW